MDHEHKIFICGIACGLAALSRVYDQPTMMINTLQGLGITLKDLIKAEVDAFDLDYFKKHMKDTL